MTLPRGRLAKPRGISNVREITKEDLALLYEKRTNVVTISQIRDSHHRVARMVAMGARDAEIAEACGYSIQRVRTLRPDPGFKQLVAEYREMITEAWKEEVSAYEKLATSNMLKSERMIADRLDKADEEEVPVPIKDLLAISRDAADRFGFGKRQTNINVNADFASQLEKMINRSKTIDGTATTVDPAPTLAPAEGPPAPVHPSPQASELVPARRRLS